MISVTGTSADTMSGAGGGGGGGGEKHAIFFQKSKALQNEFMLINVVTVR